MELFRAAQAGEEMKNPHCRMSTRRAPGNVPYLVDNLWEWKRPEGYPNRRHSVFASPSLELAQQYARNNVAVYKVGFLPGTLIAQISETDARYHPDCKRLKRMLADELTALGWVDADLKTKAAIAPLWTPCLTGEEVEELFSCGPLKELRDKIWNAITIWDDARLLQPADPLAFPDGEIFFEADQWQLHLWK